MGGAIELKLYIIAWLIGNKNAIIDNQDRIKSN